jgi:hypothetical protein
MAWIKQHHRVWRTVLLVLLLISFISPWAYDRINVPAQYECSLPNVRLEGDFCGVPLSGIRLFLWAGSGFFSICIGLITGKDIVSARIREFLMSLLLFLPLLPVFSTLQTWHTAAQRRQVITIIAWVLSLGLCLFFGLSFSPRQFLFSWGLWSYIILAASALMLEILILVSQSKGSSPA